MKNNKFFNDNLMHHSRRQFLRHALYGCGSLALGSSSFAANASQLHLAGAKLQQASHARRGFDDYKALVCIFLYGGNDAFNMVVPTSSTEYNDYKSARQGLALEQSSLLALGKHNNVDYGLHPAMAGLKNLFDTKKMALLANVGALVEPVSQIAYQQNKVLLPPQLFSHNDQQIYLQSLQSASKPTGWLGRAGDLLMSANDNQQLSMNISLSGNNIMQAGQNVFPYSMDASGVNMLSRLNNDSTEQTELNRAAVYQRILQQQRSHLFTRHFANTQQRAWALASTVNDALAVTSPITTPFPAENSLAMSLKMIGQMIAARGNLNVSRQTFFIGIGDFDTHGDQVNRQPALFSMLDEAITAFYAATVELGMENQVTTFTASDFGRTLSSNGDGTDHGWGSHQLMVGGAVTGGQIFGNMPTLALNSPDDIGEGRIIPTTSMDQYGATLGRWFGLQESDMADVYPNLHNFNRSDLGFMGA
ncbi:DUF1501 domain-containing protein [Paraglaciecola hydrolytica]|nr:DUF1501 domain-containing protein [Paraglaciecola hydrolytica]